MDLHDQRHGVDAFEKTRKRIEVLRGLARIYFFLAGVSFIIFLVGVVAMCANADPLPPQVTRCSNGSEIILVTNHTCPAGWWPV